MSQLEHSAPVGGELPPVKRQRTNGNCESNGHMSKGGETLLEIRKEYVADSQKLFYGDTPLNIVRGEGQYFFTEDGQRYLDTTNNVACVGHCHPKVVKACSEQMALLNTNSRFLNDRICTYAKKLCSKFPGKLSSCFFTNSGSEANDLALHIARVITGRQHVISLDGCYHGHLSSLIPLSKHKLAQGSGNKMDISIACLPDVYRGKYRDHETAGPHYAMEIKQIVDEQRSDGNEVAAFIHESMLSCAGQIILPKGYLKDAYKYIHDAGGVVIADEVQTGFARIGTHFWAFEFYDVCPDIVTIGKPMGNGHPVSAVVTTKDIARKFASSGVEYFNTFGGNPVSMAIAEAVLTVIEEEDLQRRAVELGTYLMEELLSLKERYSSIGDVRGVGLFIGIDVVKDKDSREPDKALAYKIKAEMLQNHKIIVHVDGIHDNVVKIKPPLVLNKENCIEFIQALNIVLAKC